MALLVLAVLALLAIGAHGGFTDQQLIDCAQGAAWCRKLMQSQPPAIFDVQFQSTRGPFTVHIVTAWAPPMAQRFWVLAQMGYATDSAFYRVLNVPSAKFVTQWGYRGHPLVDSAWNTLQLNNVTWSVQQPPGNKRGTFAFGTNAVNQVRSRAAAAPLTDCPLTRNL
jgi:hypothetical protein